MIKEDKCNCVTKKFKILTPIMKKGLLVVHIEASKAYMIFVPGCRKITMCRDVQFEEEHELRRSRDFLV